jgi:hypothetical protein
MANLRRADAAWPTVAAVDVLVTAVVPTGEAAEVDAIARAQAAVWRALPSVDHVFTRATDGGWRAVVRMKPGVRPGAAEIALRQAWLSRPEQGTPKLAAIARGARARLGTVLVAPQGRPQATELAALLGMSWLEAVPALASVRVAGGVRSYIKLEALAPALSDAHTDLDRLRATLLGLQMAPQPAAELVETLGRTPWLPQLPLGKAASMVVGAGEPTAEAYVAQLPVTLLIGEAGEAESERDLGQADAAFRRTPPVALPAGTLLQQLTMGTAYRFALVAKDAPETPEALAQRLQQLRGLEGVASVLAVQGIDGVPEQFDAGDGRRWTVWVAAGAADVPTVLSNVAEVLASGRWQVHPLAADFDTALGWMLDAPASAGVLLSAPDPSKLPIPLQKLSSTSSENEAAVHLRTGPSRRAPDVLPARLVRALARDSRLPADALDFGQRLAQGPQFIATVGGVPIWLSLPGGVRMAAQGNVPVATVAGRAWTLGELQQLPVPDLVLDRIAVDGNPAMWLAVDAKATAADGFASAFWDLVERIVDLSGGVRADPWLVGATVLAEEPR